MHHGSVPPSNLKPVEMNGQRRHPVNRSLHLHQSLRHAAAVAVNQHAPAEAEVAIEPRVPVQALLPRSELRRQRGVPKATAVPAVRALGAREKSKGCNSLFLIRHVSCKIRQRMWRNARLDASLHVAMRVSQAHGFHLEAGGVRVRAEDFVSSSAPRHIGADAEGDDGGVVAEVVVPAQHVTGCQINSTPQRRWRVHARATRFQS